MSLQAPITGVTSRCVTRLSKLPKFEEQTHLLHLNSPEATQSSIQHTFELIANGPWQLIEQLDHYYNQQLQELLNLLPHSSLPFIYLQLNQDFIEIKKIFLYQAQHQQAFGEAAWETSLQQVQTKLYFQQEFRPKLLQKEVAILKSIDSFNLISYLEEIFLIILFEKMAHSSQIMRNFILAKIDHYTCMNTIKRVQKGQSKEHLLRHLLLIQGSSAIEAIKTFNLGDVLGEIGQFLQLSAQDINLTMIEKTLINREITSLNKAQFSGMSEERVIQYTERLNHVINNYKLILAKQANQMDTQKTEARLIDYAIV